MKRSGKTMGQLMAAVLLLVAASATAKTQQPGANIVTTVDTSSVLPFEPFR